MPLSEPLYLSWWVFRLGTALTYKSDTVPLLVHTCSGKGMGGLRTGTFSSNLGLMLLKQLTQSVSVCIPSLKMGAATRPMSVYL